MVTLTQNNHFHWTYNGVPFSNRTHDSDIFKMHWDKVTRRPRDFKSECLDVVSKIKDAYPNEKFSIFFSGGVDSEVLAQSFLLAGVPFVADILRFKDGYNDHDIKYAIDFCEYYNVQYRVHEIDIVEFYKSKEYLPIGIKYQSSQIAQIQLIWLMNKIDDAIPVLGTGEVFFEQKFDYAAYLRNPKERNNRWFYYVRENNDLSVPKYAHINQRPVISEFFSYTPEIMLSYAVDPLVTKLVTNQLVGKRSVQAIKKEVYGQHFLLKPRPKYHGYETLKLLNFNAKQEMQKVIPYNDNVFQIYVKDFIESLK